MRLAVVFLTLLGLLAAQETGKDCPRKKSATLLPSFTVTPTATETPANHTTSQGPTTTPGTVHPTSNSTATSPGPTTATALPPPTTHNPAAATTTSPGNTTAHPTSNGTASTPGFSTGTPHPGPPPPPPSPNPGSKEAIGSYTWTNGSRPCVQLQAQIQIRVLYPTQSRGEAWGISVLNPQKTNVQGGCEGPHLLLSFPYGQLSFGFKQDRQQSQSVVYLNYMAVEYNVSFPRATQWTFSAQNSSLRDLQAPLGRSLSCTNASIALSPTLHLDLLSLRLQAAQLPHTGIFGPSFSCPGDQSILLPLIIGLVLLGLLTLVLLAFCIVRRRPPAYQPL